MAHDRRREHPSEQVIWISPAPPQPRKASAAVADELAGRAVITQLCLAVWDITPGDPYGLAVEVSAVNTAARARGLSRYHLFGFSAGATVALGAALALGDAVQSLTLLEAAFIGDDDDWHPMETAFRARNAAVQALPAEQSGPAFRQMLMRPGEPLPPLGPPPAPDPRSDMLEDMLAQVGFTSSDLAAITVPVLAISGGRSHPRFQLQDERLVEVIPHARAEVFGECSHLSPPHKTEPARLAEMLIDFWTYGPPATT